MKVKFRVFRSQGFADTQVETTATFAAEFADTLVPDRIIGITQILDGHIHIITVWYWDIAA